MHNFNELHTFIQIARAGSFTLAAEKIGVSKSALSHSMKNLEERLNIRLFNRNTRSISLTDAGLQLFGQIEPLFAHISDEVNALGDLQHQAQGTLRINCSDFAAQTILYPKLMPLLQDHPQINVELFCDNSLSDIIRQGFDMGVRLGETLSDEMIAVKISEPFKMVTVASPAYLARHGTPQNPHELNRHANIAMRYRAEQAEPAAWEFVQNGKKVIYPPKAHFCHNLNPLLLQAALDGLGIAWLPERTAHPALQTGGLVELFPDQAATYEPFYLYYPSRKGNSAVFRLVVDALKV